MSFFQSIFTFRNSTPNRISKAEVELAISLKNEARQLAAKADEEMINGRTTQTLALKATDKDKARIFAEITIWHNTRAAEKYRQAAERFTEAGKIQTARRKAFNIKAAELTRGAAKAKAAVKRMNEFLTQN